jgi:hypothetical protein
MKLKLIYIVPLLFLIVGGNFIYNIYSMSELRNNEKGSEKVKSRYLARMLSESLNGRKFEDKELTEIITQEKSEIRFNDLSVVILLSRLGCSECHNRELKNLEGIIAKFSGLIKIVGIFNKNIDRNTALQMKRVTGVNFEFYWGDSKFFDIYSTINEKYPQIYVINKNLIVSAFYPLPGDDEFSNWYLKNLETKILEQ